MGGDISFNVTLWSNALYHWLEHESGKPAQILSCTDKTNFVRITNAKLEGTKQVQRSIIFYKFIEL